MQNLAGDKNCDVVIRKELSKAKIQAVDHRTPAKHEVAASVTGVLKKDGQPAYTFERAWYYWVVSGNVPLKAAQEMYYKSGDVGKDDVRVVGYAGNTPPEEWTVNIGNQAFIQSYHIDSQKGLDLFVKTLKKYKLVD